MRYSPIVILLVACGQVVAGQEGKVGLDARHAGGDRVGVMLIAELKEQIARSALYKFSAESFAEMSLVSLDISSQDTTGRASAVSVMFRTPLLCKNADGKYQVELRAGHELYIVGRDRIETIAKEILANFGAFRQHQRCYLNGS